jgi:AraC family transcriptional regulator
MPVSKLKPTEEHFIQPFIGDFDADQLRFIDCFVSKKIAVFMPVAGPCMLAITPFHAHPSPLFVISFSDTTTIVFQDKRFRSSPNTVTFIPATIKHHERNDTEIPRYIAITILPDFLKEHAKSYTSKLPDWTQIQTFSLTNELLSTLKHFIGECKSAKDGSDNMLEAYSVEIVHHLLRSMMDIKAKSCLHASRIEINRCIEYMRQNLSEKLSLATLSCHAGMSVSQFTKVFRQETGLSPIDFLIEMRLEVASRQILGGMSPLKRIALECGFSSPAHFSNAFQKKFGVPPSEYLNRSETSK